MFQLGDKVTYGIHGVCQIVGIESKKIDRKIVEYYVLEPADQLGSRFYVPTHNEIAVSKLSPVLSKAELDSLLHSAEVLADAWIADENQRKQKYRELISSGNRVALLQMMHALLEHKRQQIEARRKFHQCDENFLRDAQKLLSDEFTLVLGISKESVADYIRNALEQQKM